MQWCRSEEGPGLNDARQIDREILMRVCLSICAQQIDRATSASPPRRTACPVLTERCAALRGDQYVKTPSPSKALGYAALKRS